MRKTLWFLLFLLFLLSCAQAPRFSSVYVNVKFSESFTASQKDSLHKALKTKLIMRDGFIDIIEIRSPLPGKVLGAYISNTNVLYAEPIPQ